MSYCEECSSFTCDCNDKKAISKLQLENTQQQLTIVTLNEMLQGPTGYDTWKKAAVAERLKRVKAEARFATQYSRTLRLAKTLSELVCNTDKCGLDNKQCEICEVLKEHVTDLRSLLDTVAQSK